MALRVALIRARLKIMAQMMKSSTSPRLRWMAQGAIFSTNQQTIFSLNLKSKEANRLEYRKISVRLIGARGKRKIRTVEQ